MLIQCDNEGFAPQSRQRQSEYVGSTALRMPIELCFGYQFSDASFEPVTEPAHLIPILEVVPREFGSLAQTYYRRNIFRPSSHPTFLHPTVYQRFELDALLYVQRADTFRAVKLVP